MTWLRRISKIWILLTLCLALYLPGLSSLPATDRDESRYMQATHQMIESGNFIDIRFQDEPRYKKPVGIYWLQAGVSQAGRWIGITSTERAPYRLPSVIGATIAVLALYLGFRGLIGDNEAFIASIFLSSTLLLGLEAHLAKTDAMQLAAIVTMQTGLAHIYCNRNSRESWLPRFLFWLGLSLAMLIKGPVAPTVATMTLTWLCWKDRSLWLLKELHPLRWIALPIFILGPWFLSIQGLSNGQFAEHSLGHDFLAKILEGQESHGAPPGTYLLLTPFLLWPVSWLLIPNAWTGLSRHPKNLSRVVNFAFGWLVPSWVLFEIVPTKLPHYVLPLIPALCLLGGMGFSPNSATNGAARLPSQWPQRIGMIVWVISGTIIITGLPALSLFVTGNIATPALLASMLGIATLVLAPRLRHNHQKLAASTASAIIIFGLIYQFTLPGMAPLWPAENMRKLLTSHNLSGIPVAIAGYHEPSAVFNLGTSTTLTDLTGVIRHASSQAEAIAIVPSEQTAELIQRLPETTDSRIVGHINGLNYSKGKAISLDVIHTTQPSQSKPQDTKQ